MSRTKAAGQGDERFAGGQVRVECSISLWLSYAAHVKARVSSRCSDQQRQAFSDAAIFRTVRTGLNEQDSRQSPGPGVRSRGAAPARGFPPIARLNTLRSLKVAQAPEIEAERCYANVIEPIGSSHVDEFALIRGVSARSGLSEGKVVRDATVKVECGRPRRSQVTCARSLRSILSNL